MITFRETDHQYTSADGLPWYSVTTIVGALKEPFDAQTQAPKSSVNRKSKWYGIPVHEILAAWDTERDRSTDLGRWYHNMRENNLCMEGPHTKGLSVYASAIEEGTKIAPSQKLVDGIYPEFLCYLPSARIAGQVDYLEVTGNRFSIRDYKTSKEINMNSYVNWDGVSKKMLDPVAHLEDCHLYHYALQLSIYAYIITRYNPHLQLDSLTIEHILFEEESQDRYGYPVYRKNEYGDYIVREIREIPVPYLYKEVISIIGWMKNNTDKLQKK